MEIFKNFRLNSKRGVFKVSSTRGTWRYSGSDGMTWRCNWPAAGKLVKVLVTSTNSKTSGGTDKSRTTDIHDEVSVIINASGPLNRRCCWTLTVRNLMCISIVITVSSIQLFVLWIITKAYFICYKRLAIKYGRIVRNFEIDDLISEIS